MGSLCSLWPLTLKALVLHCVKSSWAFATAPCCAPCLSTWGGSREILCQYLGWVTNLHALSVYMNLTSMLCTCSCDVMMRHVMVCSFASRVTWWMQFCCAFVFVYSVRLPVQALHIIDGLLNVGIGVIPSVVIWGNMHLYCLGPVVSKLMLSCFF